MPTPEGSTIDPSQIQTRAEFAAALKSIREQQGRSIRDVARDADIPPATLSGYFTGRYLPQPTQRALFEKLLAALGLDDADAWWAALLRARRGRRRQIPIGTPYRGLNSYSVDDAPWFVGREQLTTELVAAVQALRAAPTARVLVVMGASGAGKTSLLRAGLQAELLKQGVTCTYFAPGQSPDAALDEALAGAKAADGQLPQVLVADQFEAIFMPGVADQDRADFLHRLTGLATSPELSTVVVIGVRGDFFGELVDQPLLFPYLDHQFRVGPLDSSQLRRVIVEPVQRAGGTIEPELVERLLQDSARAVDGQPLASALPLTSHALLAAWEAAGDGNLTLRAYESAGGIEGAVRRTAEEIYAGLSSEGRAATEALFALLTSVDAEGRAIRRRVDHATVDATTPDDVLVAFLDGRILGADEESVEIVHDIVFSAWPRLAEWVARDRDRLRTRERISQATLGWQESGQDEGLLLRGTLLGLAGELRSWKTSLSPAERDFITQSQAAEAASHARRARSQRRLRGLAATAVALSVVASLLAVYLFRAQDDAEQQRSAAVAAEQRAVSRQGAVVARALRAKDPSLAMQLALASYRIDPTLEARSALLESTGQPMASRLVGPSGTTKSVVAPDGRLLAVAGVDGRVRLYRHQPKSISAPQALATVVANQAEQLYAAAFSPDGRLLAVGGSSGKVTIIDVSNPEEPRAWPQQLAAAKVAVQGLAFARDGRLLLAATSTPALVSWRLRSDQGTATAGPMTSDGMSGDLYSVDTLPDGAVVTSGGDGVLRLWRVGANQIAQLGASNAAAADGSLYAVAANPAGTLIATGAGNGQVRLWRRKGQTLALQGEPLQVMASRVNAVDFSDDGQLVAAAASGAMVMVWQTQGGAPVGTFPGTAHYGSVQVIDSGTAVLGSSIDGITKIWPMTAARNVALAGSAWSLAVSGDGQLGYVGMGGATTELDLSRPGIVTASGRTFTVPPESATLNGCSGVSPDGRLVVGGTSEGTLLVWRVDGDAQPGNPVTVPVMEQGAGDGGGVSNVMFSPDGRFAYASTMKGTVAAYAVVGDSLRLLDRTTIGAMAMAFSVSPDGRWVAVGATDKSVHLLHLVNGKWVRGARLTGPQNYVYMTAFSPDGKTVVAGSEDKRIYRWDLTDPDAPRPLGEPLYGPENAVYSVAYLTPTLIAGASLDERLWIWHGQGRELKPWARLEGLGTGIYQLASLPNRRSALVAGLGSKMTEFSVDTASVAEQICAMAGAPISRDEWRRYLPEVPYQPPCPGD